MGNGHKSDNSMDGWMATKCSEAAGVMSEVRKTVSHLSVHRQKCSSKLETANSFSDIATAEVWVDLRFASASHR